jgi:hypothetical protein
VVGENILLSLKLLLDHTTRCTKTLTMSGEPATVRLQECDPRDGVQSDMPSCKCDAFDFPLLILISFIYIFVHLFRIISVFLTCRRPSSWTMSGSEMLTADAKLPDFTQWDMQCCRACLR